MTSKPTEHIRWIDIGRVLSIALVLLHHAILSQSWLCYLTDAGVFFFYFFAGYFTPKTQKALVTRIGWLICTYVLWTIISILLNGHADHAPQTFLAWGLLLDSGSNFALWFLKTLIFFNVLLLLTQRWQQLLPIVIFIGLLSLSINQYPFFHTRLIHPLWLIPPYAGYLFARHNLSLSSIQGFLWQKRPYFLLLTICIILASILPPRWIGLDYKQIPFNIINIVSMFYGACALAIIAMYVEKYSETATRLLILLSPSVIWIYASHCIIYRNTWAGLLTIFHGYPWAIWFLIVPVLMLFLHATYLIVRKFCPLMVKALCIGKIR